MPPELHANLAVLLAAVVALALTLLLGPPTMSRSLLLVAAGAGFAGMVLIAAAPNLEIVILVLLALGILHAGAGGRRDFAVRIRGPVVATALVGLALFFAQVQGPQVLNRFAAVGLVAGLAAGVGLLPYIHELDAEEPAVLSPIAWIGFVGPVLATAVVLRARELLPVDAGGTFGAMLIGLGLLNVAWGSLASWRTEVGAAAWHYSFMADWGLVLCGFGLEVADGQSAALVVLLSILLGRLPLYVASRQALFEKKPTERPINLVVAAVLAGSAPFAGFAARVLLFRAATEIYWPLALVLAAGMLLWLPGALRLGQSLGQPRGRQAFGVGLVVTLNVAIGLYPLPLLSLAGQ
jgi:hypothetical protein